MPTLVEMARNGTLLPSLPDYHAYQASRNYLSATKVPVYSRTNAVVIGKFSPLTLAHEDYISGALNVAKTVLLVVGSSFEAQSIKLPFTFEQRREMIEFRFSKEVAEGRLIIVGMEDYKYRDNKWYSEFHKLCNKQFGKGLYDLYLSDKDAATAACNNGFDKTVPVIKHIAKDSVKHINATDVRDLFFKAIPTLNIPDISGDVAMRLHTYKHTPEYATFCKEYGAVLEYRQKWKPLKDKDGNTIRNPFPVQFMATDALCVWKNRWGQPHILVIRRGSEFGNGKLALPGGYLDHTEVVKAGAARELKEETGLVVDDSFILNNVRVFDAPDRSLRGRMVTFCHEWQVCSEVKPEVKGNDDASEAFWLPIDEVYSRKRDFFSDHYHIIAAMLPVVESF